MGDFLRAAYEVLRDVGTPMTARALTETALRAGRLVTSGKTPWQTMKSKLSTDILSQGDSSLFMRSEQGLFGLREWQATIPEFKADRYQKALFDEDIVVFPAASIKRYVPTPGLHRARVDSRSLYAELRPMRRRIAEETTSVIQLVSVFIVRHQAKILTHKRTKRLPESRLHGYYSLNFGGHLNPQDIVPLFDLFDPDQGFPWLLRELGEEVLLGPLSPNALRYRGLLYDTSREISRQHLGVVYEVRVEDPRFRIGERGFLTNAVFETPDEIQARREAFENWSQLLLDELSLEWRSQCS